MQKMGFLLLLLVAIGIGGCSTKQKMPADFFKGESAEAIFEGGEQALVKHRYESAAKHFEALDALYPFSPYQPQAQLDLIYAYYQTRDYASAAATAVRYIHLYPRSEHVDYAYYMRGLSNFNQERGVFQRYVATDLSRRDLGTSRQAFSDFGELIRRYPDSPYAPDARNRMIYLRNLMAEQELHVAKFYFERDTYVASANRANYIVTHYQHAPAVIPALGIMAQSYDRLGLIKLANQTMDVLKYNYPDSDVYQELSSLPKDRRFPR